MIQRIYYYDFLNIIACMAVIALHHNGIVHSFTPTTNWDQALFIEVICYWAVPIFFMLSGATLMGYRERYSTKEFFYFRIKRTLIPFIVWSIVWAIFYYRNAKEIPSLYHLIYKIFNTEYQPVYWFFLPLFGIYLLVPIISLLKNNRKELKYLLLIIFIIEGILMPIYNFAKVNPIGANNLSGPVFFFISGYLISSTKRNFNEKILLVLTILCFIIRYMVTYQLSYTNNETSKVLFGYYYFTSIIPAITLFIYVRNYFPKNIKERTRNVIKKLSSYSLGVYLLHKFIIHLELKILTQYSLDNSWWGFRTFMVIITYLICITIVHFFKKTQIGEFILP